MQVATKAVLSKENMDALFAKIKSLVSMWADEEQLNGKSIFYWNIRSNPYSRLIESVKAFLEQARVSFHDDY